MIDGVISGSISGMQSIAGELSIVGGIVPVYHGEYNVTPSAETQTLPTEGMMLRRNVVIAPIPSNYGLITWNGSILTVS